FRRHRFTWIRSDRFVLVRDFEILSRLLDSFRLPHFLLLHRISRRPSSRAISLCRGGSGSGRARAGAAAASANRGAGEDRVIGVVAQPVRHGGARAEGGSPAGGKQYR
uniref:Uncharacterized protein n=1 Tax=Oryza meridionalis TaxID=40149 RepID=A0A0E0CVZ2_9ORYZ